LCQAERDHNNAVLKPLKVTLAVKRLEGIRGEELECTEERLEAELHGEGFVGQLLYKRGGVLIEQCLLVVVVVDQVTQALFKVVEEHHVLVDVLQEVLTCGFVILLKLDL